MKKKAITFTPEIFNGLETLLHEVVQEEITPMVEELKQDIHHHQKIVDSYIKKTDGWHDEQIILTARVDRVRDVMVKKNLASPKELAV